MRRWAAAIGVAVVLPLGLLAVLRTWPDLDLHWHNQQAHFWLVLAAAAVAAGLGYHVYAAARRRADARLLLVSLAFCSGAGFLGLHALATPGVLLGPNAGFELATPVGLLLGGGFVAASAMDLPAARSQRIMSQSGRLLGGLTAVIAAWALISVAELPPLDDPVPQEPLQVWQVTLGLVGVLGYGAGAAGYLRLYRRRADPLVLAVGVAFALLAVTMVVVAFAANWRVSWWEWHGLMLVAFGLIAVAANRQWHEERFSALYLEHTLAGTGEASILFADLEGFTAFSERSSAQEVQAMLRSYQSRLVPLCQRAGGEVHQLIGDAVMVVFNKQGDQPDHAGLCARAALEFQREAAAVAAEHPEWPQFRVGLNSGEVAVGVLGAYGHRKHDVIGDTVNLAARLEAGAPVGQVVIGEGTLERLPAVAIVERLPPLSVKGKAEPVTAYVLHALPDDP
jgi:adenylate cyclase